MSSILKPLAKEDLKYFDECELWDQGKDIEEFYYCLDLEEELLGHFYESAKDIQYKVGDIIMCNNFETPDGKVTDPHRLLVITAFEGQKYYGLVMSSKVEKASVYDGGYTENILVDNVADIITAGQKPNMPCIVKVNFKVPIDRDNFDDYGVYKGHVSNEFLAFINKASDIYLTKPEFTKNLCWQDGCGRLIED